MKTQTCDCDSEEAESGIMWWIPLGSLSLYLQHGGESNQAGSSIEELTQVGLSIEELTQTGLSFEELTQVDLLLNNEVTDRSV